MMRNSAPLRAGVSDPAATVLGSHAAASRSEGDCPSAGKQPRMLDVLAAVTMALSQVPLVIEVVRDLHARWHSMGELGGLVAKRSRLIRSTPHATESAPYSPSGQGSGDRAATVLGSHAAASRSEGRTDTTPPHHHGRQPTDMNSGGVSTYAVAFDWMARATKDPID